MEAPTEITVRMTRGSVAMGDDATAPHEWVFPVHTLTTVSGLVEIVTGESYLAGVSGGRATWVLEARAPNAGPLAVLTQQRDRERWPIDPGEYLTRLHPGDPRDVREVAVYVRYRAQADPDEVYAELAAHLDRRVPPADVHVPRDARRQPPRPPAPR
jgi:hypothetical protein